MPSAPAFDSPPAAATADPVLHPAAPAAPTTATASDDELTPLLPDPVLDPAPFPGACAAAYMLAMSETDNVLTGAVGREVCGLRARRAART